MLDRLLHPFGLPTRRELTGAVLTDPATPREVEGHRVRRIAKAMINAGADHVFTVGDGDFGFPRAALAGLLRSQADRPLLVCPSGQYHASSHHFGRLAAAAAERRGGAEYDWRGSKFLGNMGLLFRAAAVWPGTRAPQVRVGYSHFSQTEPVLPADGSTAVVPVQEEDVQAGYREYAETTTPMTVVIELNSTCNFKCTYCPFHGEDPTHPHYVQPGTAREMAIADFDRLVGQVAGWKTPYETTRKTIAPFWSGEFFLAQNWLPALESIRRHGLRSYVCSNASVLTEEIVDRVVESDMLDHLSISLDATSDELNREIRRNKKYAHILEVIDRLLDKRAARGSSMVVALNFTLVGKNRHIVQDYVRLWERRVDYVLLGPRHYLPPNEDQSVFEPWPAELAAQVPILTPRPVPCTYLYNTVTVDCHQNLQLCAPCGSKRYYIGSVKEKSIPQVQAESPLFQSVARMHKEGTYMDYPYCGSCQMSKGHFMTEGEAYGQKIDANHSAWVIHTKAA